MIELRSPQETVLETVLKSDLMVKPQSQRFPTLEELLAKAKVLLKVQERSLALALLREASNLQSAHFEVLTLLAQTLTEMGRKDEALQVRKALKAKFPSFLSCFQWAEALYQSGRSDEEALKAYFECLALAEKESPELFEIYKNMGNISVKLKDYDGAEEFYNKSYTLNNRSDILLVNFGTLEVQRGDFNKALYCFREAVALNPRNDKAWVGLALMHSEFGDLALAWANLEAALDIEPLNRTAVVIFARWALRDKREVSAIGIVENYLSQDNFDEELSLILIHLYSALNLFAKAENEAVKVQTWNPKLKVVKEVRRHIQQLEAKV